MKTENQIPYEQFEALDKERHSLGFTSAEWAASSGIPPARISELRKRTIYKRALTARKWAALAIGLQKLKAKGKA